MKYRYDILIETIKQFDLKVGVEIGVKRGENIKKVLQACPNFHFYAVDCWDPKLQYINWAKGAQSVNEKFFNKLNRTYPDRITKLKGYSAEMSKMIGDNSVDLIFVDGDHSFEGCTADIELWYPKLKLGGFIAGHDYGHERFPGVKQAVDKIFPNAAILSDMVWLIQKE